MRHPSPRVTRRRDESLHGAVIAGVIPDQSPRVLKEAARYAKLFQAPLVVVHVDVTRFVTYEDPDGYVHSAPIDINIAAGEGELAKVQDAAASVLGDTGPQLDACASSSAIPAMAIKHFADQVDARLIVVGTRKRGLRRVGPRVLHRFGRRAPRAPAAPPDPGRAARRAGARRRGDLARLSGQRHDVRRVIPPMRGITLLVFRARLRDQDAAAQPRSARVTSRATWSSSLATCRRSRPRVRRRAPRGRGRRRAGSRGTR